MNSSIHFARAFLSIVGFLGASSLGCSADPSREAGGQGGQGLSGGQGPGGGQGLSGAQGGAGNSSGNGGQGANGGNPSGDGSGYWSEDRFDIIDDALGFGRNVTGGLGGDVIAVTSLANAGPGTLRDAVTGSAPRWVVFEVSGTIQLSSHILVGSNVTIDGRGADITVAGAGLKIGEVDNVLVTNVTFDQGTGDAINIIDASTNVWLDHLTLSGFTDGLIDITRASTDITVSWCHFHDHDKVSLIGADGADVEDVAIRATYHHNYFEETNQRHPSIRYGRLHVFNNYTARRTGKGIGYGYGAEVNSENNIYEGPLGGDPRAIFQRDDQPDGSARSTGDVLENGALTVLSTPEAVFDASDFYPYSPAVADDSLRDAIVEGAGVHSIDYE